MQVQKPTNWFDWRRRGPWIAGFFFFAVAVMTLGALTPVSLTEARPIYNQFENQVKYTATVTGIFGNNLFQCLILFAPFIGPLYAVLVFYNTGFIIAVIGAVRSTSPLFLDLSLFIFPHTWLEFFAYSLALSQSAFLAIAIIKGRFRQELVRTGVIIAVCALILLLAAIAEVILISVS